MIPPAISAIPIHVMKDIKNKRIQNLRDMTGTREATKKKQTKKKQTKTKQKRIPTRSWMTMITQSSPVLPPFGFLRTFFVFWRKFFFNKSSNNKKNDNCDSFPSNLFFSRPPHEFNSPLHLSRVDNRSWDHRFWVFVMTSSMKRISFFFPPRSLVLKKKDIKTVLDP